MESTPQNTYQVLFKILHKETNKPLPDVLVVLLDLDSFNDPEKPVILMSAPESGAASTGPDITKLLSNFSSYNRLFSGITDAEGKAAATVLPKDFNTGEESEQKPDLLLLVLAPEEPGLDLPKRLLYLSNDFRVNAGSSEAYIVRLGTVLLKEKQIPIPQADGNDLVDAKIAAYQARSAGDDQFHGAILDLEKAKTQQRQTDFVQSRDQLKNLFTPTPINAVGSNYSTFVGENEAVKDKVADHFTRETTKAITTIQNFVTANKGIEVSFVLNKKDRDTLGFDASVLAISGHRTRGSRQGGNLLIFGPSGTGKTHLAAAFGAALVDNGKRVLFTRTTDLVQKLQAARRDLALPGTLAKLDRFDVLVLDDLGYVRKDQAETNVLFELIAERYERRSLIATCNQPFSEWDQIFPDPAMTVAAIDRLVHHATILELNTESYRRRSALASGAKAASAARA